MLYQRPVFILATGIAVVLATVGLPSVASAAPAEAAIQTASISSNVWSPPDSADDGSVETTRVPEGDWVPSLGGRFGIEPGGSERDSQNRAPAGTTAGAPGLGELSWFAFEEFPLSVDTMARVNLANGNLLITANDAEIAGPGYSLRHDRFYNGLSTDAGSLGGGWASSNGSPDVGLSFSGDDATFHAPNGANLLFESVTPGTYSSAPGSNATLEMVASSGLYAYELTYNRTGEQLKFADSGYLTASVDRNGVGVIYDYNFANMVSATHTDGRSLELDWTNDHLTAMTDSAGRVTEYGYDYAFRLTSVLAPDGTKSTYTYDSTGRLATVTVPNAATATTTVTFGYDSAHRVTSITQKSTSNLWGSKPDIVTSFSYATGVTSVTDPNSEVSTYTLDSSGRVVSTKDALNRTRSQTWTANSDVATASDALGSGSTPANTTTYSYDGSNNVTSATLPTGAAASATYAVGTSCGAPNTGTAFQPKCSTDPAGNTKSFEYDATGNLNKRTDTSGSSGAVEVEYTYDTSARSVCGGFAGQICTSKDGNGNTTTYAYDTAGNLTAVTPPSPQNPTTYTHDSLGRVLTVTDGNSDTTTYGYDLRDRLVSTTYQGGATVTMSYYPNGLEKTTTDSAGGTKTLEYDAQGRITKQTGPSIGVLQKYAYSPVGTLLTYEDAGGTVTHSYDAARQLTRVKEPGGTCPPASATLSPASSGCTLFSYDANGAETTRAYPGRSSVETSRDASGRPTRITAKGGTGTIAVDIGYSYTAAGTSTDQANVQTRTSHKEEGITAGAITTYSYDTLNRVTLAQEKSGTATTASWAYAYDQAGNRTSQTRTGSTGATAGTIGYTYNAANQLTATTADTTTWTYDGAGNQTRNGATGATAAYGARLQTTQLGSTTQGFFGGGNTDRVAAGAVTFSSSALGLAQRKSGATTHTFTRTATGALVGLRSAYNHYYVLDHLGSVVGLFSASGVWEGGYSYSPYGETRAASTLTSAVINNTLRYITGEHDTAGIYKLGARYYDSTIGRFTQMDPSGQEVHPFGYAGCNPINAKDPSGLASTGCVLLGGIAAGAGVGAAYSAAVTAGLLPTIFGWLPSAAVAVGLGLISAVSGAGAWLVCTITE